MNYIILDLEWNQCPQGKKQEEKSLPFEIVEIGAVKLDDNKTELSRFHEIIKPVVYDSLHYITKEIIHRDMKDFADARTFPEVIHSFLEWAGPNCSFCSWGSTDLLELQRNMRYHGIANPFPFPLFFCDIQKIFSISCEDGKSRRTLEYAVDQLHIPKEFPFHNALHDACYTTLVLQRLNTADIVANYSIDFFRCPSNRKEEIHALYDTYYKYVSKEFPDKTEAMKDRRVTSTQCYLCRQAAHKKVRWFSTGGKNYYCLAYCKEHGYIKGKIRLKKTDRDTFFCVKTLKLITPAEAREIRERKELLRNKKAKKRMANK